MRRIALVALGLCATLAGCAAGGGKDAALANSVRPVAFACPAEGLRTTFLYGLSRPGARIWHGASADDPVLCKYDEAKSAVYGDNPLWNDNKDARAAWAAAFQGKPDKQCFQDNVLSLIRETCIIQTGVKTVQLENAPASVAIFSVTTTSARGAYDRDLYYDIAKKLFVKQDAHGTFQRGGGSVPPSWTQTIM